MIYRMPAGLNLSKPKSRCPKCLTPIRMRHNIPVFGWLMLRGKCFDCKAPISFRYPLIEATVGGLFVLLLLWEFASGGANLPNHTEPPISGLIRLVSSRHSGTLFSWYGWHVTLLTLLLAMAMMQFDRERIPVRLLMFTLIPALIVTAFLPKLYLVPHQIPGIPFADASVPGASGSFSFSLSGPITGLTGLLSGFLVGGFFGLIAKSVTSPSTNGTQSVRNLAFMGAVIGFFLGWQAICCLVLMTLLATLILLICNRSQLLQLAGITLFLSSLLFILWWRDFQHLLEMAIPLGERLTGILLPLTILLISTFVLTLWVKKCPSNETLIAAAPDQEESSEPASEQGFKPDLPLPNQSGES
ncbi:MAG: prepilin peptidase [Planctomycetaceae bacterium]